MLEQKIEELLRYANRHKLVGSRITCNPPPVDTDQDVLVYIDPENADYFVSLMKQRGFDVELGEGYAEDALNGGESNRFQSYRLGDVNLIVTIDEMFYDLFAYATEIAKRCNLMEKEERVKLFQAILYGNLPNKVEHEEPAAVHSPPTLLRLDFMSKIAITGCALLSAISRPFAKVVAAARKIFPVLNRYKQ